MRSSQALNDQITDAISRGRLCLAEGCGLSRPELDAICELGAEKLELGLADEAVTVLRGLVALYPFSSKYYLCLGVALLQTQQTRAAATALKLALTLAPKDLTIRVTLIEALLKAGFIEQAQKAFEQISNTAELGPASLERLQVIESCLTYLQTDENVPAPVHQPAPTPTDTTTFKLPNGTPLPLQNSQYEVTQPMIAAPESQVTQTQPTPMLFDESVTITAVVRRRRPATASDSRSSEVTQTAVVVRRNITSPSSESNENTALSYFPEADKET